MRSLFPRFLHWCLSSRLIESTVLRVHFIHKRMPDSYKIIKLCTKLLEGLNYFHGSNLTLNSVVDQAT